DQLVADFQRPVALPVFTVAALERLPRPILQLVRDIDVEAFDLRQFLDRYERHFLERPEALGHQQMGDDLVDIERIDEQLAAGAELLGAALRFFGLGQDIDVPAGQLRSEEPSCRDRVWSYGGLEFRRVLFRSEAFDLRQFLDRYERHFLERPEALGHQQMGDDLVDIERIDEQLAAGAELLGAALRFFGLGQDIDVPAGQLRGEPDILAAAADGEAQLIIGN